MKLHSKLALSVLLLAACVPASEPRPPAGAAGFTAEPSPAARGEPVTTADGWTVTFTKVIVQGYVNVYPVAGSDMEQGFSGANDVWLWDGSRAAMIYARELGAGPWEIDVRLMSHYGIGYDEGDDDPVINLGVSSQDEARFRLPSDTALGRDQEYGGQQGPNVLIALRAEKGGHTVELDLTWAAVMSSTSADIRVRREVRADDVVVGPLLVEPEQLLVSEEDHELRFEPIAAADADHDGRVTPNELAAAPGPVELYEDERPSHDKPGAINLEYALVVRCGNILVPR